MSKSISKSQLKIVGHSNGHTWAEWVFADRVMICCNLCGTVRRSDGQPNRECKGRVSVALRGED